MARESRGLPISNLRLEREHPIRAHILRTFRHDVGPSTLESMKLSTSPPTSPPPPAPLAISNALRRCAALCFLPLLLLTSCVVSFVAPYDEVTDRAIQESVRQMEVVIADVLSQRSGYERHAAAYREIDGSLAAIELRAGLYEKNEAELETLGKLRKALGNLRRIHQEIGPFRRAEAEGVRSLYRSLLHHELSKQRSASLSKPS